MKPFSELEISLREICHSNPFILKRDYVTKNELDNISKITGIDFRNSLQIPFDDALDEDSFFNPGENIGIVEHARYLPPLLHSHTFFELVYNREGHCVNYIDNKPHTLSPGDICIIAPGHEHALAAFSDDCDVINLQIRTSTFESSFLGLMSEKDVLSDFFMHCLYNIQGQNCITFRTGDDSVLNEISKNLAKEFYGNTKYKGQMMDSLISYFFIHLLRYHEKDVLLVPDGNSPKDENLILMLQYIQNNYSNLSLAELARFFGYSERHVARIIKNSTGKNFSEITKELRMKKAAELLNNKELPIPSIMEMIGYNDLSTFYKAFKSFYGMTPAKYRESTNP